MHRSKWMFIAMAAACVAGCATVPDVTIGYYPYKWTSTVSVVRTITCDKSHTSLIILSTPTISTSYSADTREKRKFIGTSDFNGGLGWLTDSDLNVGFTEDGRLKSINQSTTGQGEAVIKAGVAVVTAFMTLAVDGAKRPECANVDGVDDGKPVTLVYRKKIESSTVQTLDLELDKVSQGLKQRLKIPESLLPTPKVAVTGLNIAEPRASYTAHGSERVFLLPLQKMGMLTFKFTVGSENLEVLNAVIPTDQPYSLPIPKAALFGKQSFSIALLDSGEIASLSYGRTAGVAGALNAVGSIAGTETMAAKAANLKAEADVIAQQTRLANCTAKPSECK